MKLEDLLTYYDMTLTVIEHRYGNGYVAGAQLNGMDVLSSVNDMNGECQWEVFGLWCDNSWFPIADGQTVALAMENLGKKIADWSATDGEYITTALNVIRSTERKPQYFQVVVPKTMEELHVWVKRWDGGECSNDELFQTVTGRS